VDQKRQFPRFALEAAVTVSAGGRRVSGRTSNLSKGGLCAMLEGPVPVGSRVDVELALIFENDSVSEPLTVTGRVVWCTAIQAQHQVGLSFLPLAPDALKFLDVFLKFLQDGKASVAAAAAAGGARDPFDH
jgi:hypothetical protein